MTYGRLVSSSILAVTFTAILVFGTGCGSDTTPGVDVAEDEGPQDFGVDKTQKITFITPDPAARQLVSGTYKAEFKYEDALGLPAQITVGFYKQPAFTPIVIEAPKPGTYSVDLDTTLIPDGNRSIEATAVASDTRTISARGKVLVDNNAPLISVLDPTPVEGTNFIKDLAIRVKVTDDGNKVHHVRITAREFEWVWPDTEGTTSDVVDTRVMGDDGVSYTDISISTLGWVGGPVKFTVTADDGVSGHSSKVQYTFNYSETPGFVGGEALPLPAGKVATQIAGIPLGLPEIDRWGVAVSEGNAGLSIYERASRNILETTIQVSADPCPVFVVAKMNDDDLYDIVAYRTTATDKSIVIFAQQEDSTFVELVSIPVEDEVLNIATGRLNYDEWPDIAFINSNDTYSTGIILTTLTESDDLDSWGAANVYSGAVNPRSVAIGRFYENKKNAVVVGRPDGGMVTVFPVSEDGVASSGEDSILDADRGVIKGVTSLATVNFSDMDDFPDTVLFTVVNKESALGVAQMNVDSSRIQWKTSMPSGLAPSDMVIGDIDGNGIVDAAVLCAGSNMVEIFLGNMIATSGFLKEGPALLAGAARDLTLADLDGEGHTDLVLLDRDGTSLVFIAFEATELGNRYQGSYQAFVGLAPMSVQLGHFTAPLSGDKESEFLDAAVLLSKVGDEPYRVSVESADSVVGMPIQSAGAVELTLLNPKKIVAGELNELLSVDSSDPNTRPDDLIVTSGDDVKKNGDGTYAPTGETILFSEYTHAAIGFKLVPSLFKKSPALAAVADLDGTGGGEPYRVNDVGYIWRVEAEGSVPGSWQLSSELGKMDGTFLTMTSGGDGIAPIGILDDFKPVAISSFSMRRSLYAYTQGNFGFMDLLVANGGTADFTVFVNKGMGIFNAKSEGSRDFALGGDPIDLAPGYLRSNLKGTMDSIAASNELPDVAALLAEKIVVLYSVDKDGITAVGDDPKDTVGFESPVPIDFAGVTPVQIELADMNGDGFTDIVVLDRDDSRVWIYVNLGKRRFSEPFAFDTGVRPVEMSIGDVDDDGCLDIVTADEGGVTLTTLKNTGVACRKE